VRSAFERALPPDPRTMSDKAYGRKIEEMKALGLVDDSNKSTVLDPTGTHIDVEKFLTTVRSHADSMDISTRNSIIKGVFGEQGARGVDMLMDPKVRQQEQELKREFPQWKGQYDTFMEDYNRQSPVQQFRTSWQDALNVLTDIGQVALPPVVSGLHQLDDWLKTAASLLPTGMLAPKEGTFSNFAAKAGVAAATGGLGVNDAAKSGLEWLESFWKKDAQKNLRDGTQEGSSKGSAEGSEKGSEEGSKKGIWEGLKSFLGGSSRFWFVAECFL
jgi:hypothetical protein